MFRPLFECTGFSKRIEKCLVRNIVRLIEQCRLCDQNIRTSTQTVTFGNKVRTQKAFGSVTVHGIAYFFTGNESYLITVCFLIEKYKVGSVPGFCGVSIHAVKRFTGLYARKMFNLGDGIIPPVSFCLLLFLQQSLFYRSSSSFLF